MAWRWLWAAGLVVVGASACLHAKQDEGSATKDDVAPVSPWSSKSLWYKKNLDDPVVRRLQEASFRSREDGSEIAYRLFPVDGPEVNGVATRVDCDDDGVICRLADPVNGVKLVCPNPVVGHNGPLCKSVEWQGEVHTFPGYLLKVGSCGSSALC